MRKTKAYKKNVILIYYVSRRNINDRQIFYVSKMCLDNKNHIISSCKIFIDIMKLNKLIFIRNTTYIDKCMHSTFEQKDFYLLYHILYYSTNITVHSKRS